jgi:hypothetical protein
MEVLTTVVLSSVPTICVISPDGASQAADTGIGTFSLLVLSCGDGCVSAAASRSASARIPSL